jgi:hypothetical protein
LRPRLKGRGPGGHPADGVQQSAGAVRRSERRRGVAGRAGGAAPADPERAEAEAGGRRPGAGRRLEPTM